MNDNRQREFPTEFDKVYAMLLLRHAEIICITNSETEAANILGPLCESIAEELGPF